MGKKKQSSALGKTVIKDRFGGRKKATADSFLHTSELNDGYEWGRLNLQSVTEQSNLDEFLATAELAGTEFTAEKLNVQFVDSEKHTGLLSAAEEKIVKSVQEENKMLLKIPRRPHWDVTTTPEELDQMERDSFLDWRKQLAELQQNERLTLTPFERNLDFWRQLWRVIEKSDIVVQIVDARNPLLFRCEDLEKYVKEVNKNKVNVILINKADLLTDEQRNIWAQFFDVKGITVAFWSAFEETERNKAKAINEETVVDPDRDVNELSEDESSDESDTEYNLVEMKEEEENRSTNSNSDKEISDSCKTDETNELCNRPNTETLEETPEDSSCASCSEKKVTINELDSLDSRVRNTSITEPLEADIDPNLSAKDSNCGSDVNDKCRLLTGDELLEFLVSLHTTEKVTEGITTLGLVGYPNVGKSSTINALLQTKKVPVSATPGRTKHFQTLYVDKNILLCDCPGLVMPTFVSTKADMVVSGILPIDQMRDYVPPTSLVCRHIPRVVLEATYGIIIPRPLEGEDPDRLPTAHELLGTYGYMRGFMTHKGVPDFPRSARCILKDYMNGKLLYCHPPDGVSIEEFNPVPELKKKETKHKSSSTAKKPKKMDISYMSAVDEQFFAQNESKIRSKGKHGVVNYTRKDGFTQHHSAAEGGLETGSTCSSQSSISGKPWKKHGNKGRKEKLRRVHRELDVHSFNS